eukprot:UN01149
MNQPITFTVLFCILFGTSLSCSGQACDNYAQLNVEGNSCLYINNNQWGASNANAGYCQCVSAGPPRVNYEFWAKDQTDNHVMSYPSIIDGWNFGQWTCGQNNGGLPFQVNANKTILTSWHVSHSNDAGWEAYDVSWDIWMGDSANPKNPSGELMIWLANTNCQPAGSIHASNLQFWGTTWDLWTGTGGAGTPIWSFRNTRGIWSVDNVNINDMLLYLMNNGLLQRNQWLIGIQAGQEIFQGKGTFTHEVYKINIY